MKPAATLSSNSRDVTKKVKSRSTNNENRKPPPLSNKTDGPLTTSVFSSSLQDQRVNGSNTDILLSSSTFPSSQTSARQGCDTVDKVKKLAITSTDEDSHEMMVWNEPNANTTGSTPILSEHNFRWCGIIANVYHAWKCPFNDSSGGILAARRCTTLSGCRAIKDLYQHIQASTCNSPNCMYGNLCREATEAVQHFKRCKSEACPICGPVVRHIPFMTQAIQQATEETHREVAMVKKAQSIIMSDLGDICNANTNVANDHTEPTSSQHPLSTPSSPSIPRVIGVMNGSDGKIDMTDHGPPKKRCHHNPYRASN